MEENTLKYRRPDIEGGYIYDKNEIEYYRATQRADVIDNGLLGDFNMVGAYVVNNAIVEELINLNKVCTEAYGKSFFCESIKKFENKSIRFKLNINAGVPTYKKVTVTLELLEAIDKINGFYQNTNTIMVTSKIYDNRSNIKDVVFKDFHIFENLSDDQAGAKVENNYDTRNIIVRKKEAHDLKVKMAPINNKLEKRLFEKRMKALLSSPKSAIVIEEFNRQVFHCKDRFLDKNSPDYYRFVNQVLDTVLQTSGYQLNDENVWKLLKAAQTEFSNEYFKYELLYNSQLQHGYNKEQEKEFKKYTKKVNADEQKNNQQEEQKPEEKQENNENNSNELTQDEKNILSGIKPPVFETKPAQPKKEKAEKKKVEKRKKTLDAMESELDKEDVEDKMNLTINLLEEDIENEENY